MNGEIELKPCPFCGGEAKVFSIGTEYKVYCTGCSASTGWYFQSGEAIENAVAAWNRREE